MGAIETGIASDFFELDEQAPPGRDFCFGRDEKQGEEELTENL
ncbi:MAG TPA: hypothetical protein VMF91_26550 [Bryobacteraceae bacterium]|nr:hypothetical protein [Bryobacteraceae bacterium]